MQDCADDPCLTRRVERPAAGDHLVQDRAEGKQVRPRVGGLAFELLGRHVLEGADNRSLLSECGAGLAPERGRLRLQHRASPKSSSFTPDLVSMMLAGLRSRCTMPWL